MSICKCPEEQNSAESWWEHSGCRREHGRASGLREDVAPRNPQPHPGQHPAPPSSIPRCSSRPLHRLLVCPQTRTDEGQAPGTASSRPRHPPKHVPPAFAPGFSSSDDSAPSLTHHVEPSAGGLALLPTFFWLVGSSCLLLITFPPQTLEDSPGWREN